MSKTIQQLPPVNNTTFKVLDSQTLSVEYDESPAESRDSAIVRPRSMPNSSNAFSPVVSTCFDTKALNQSPATRKVFVIEDDMFLRNLLETKFALSNIQHKFSVDGLGVNDMIRAFQPHVIIFDITIGAINGLDLLEQLKSENDLASIPAIIFSNQDSDQERERATRLGAHNYLVKVSTDLNDLIEIVQQAA